MAVIILDLETTGLDPKQDEIIEIGAVRLEDDGRISGEFQQLLRPAGSISSYIANLTGITNFMVAEQPLLEEVLPAFIDFCQGADFLVGHNSNFDKSFIDRYLPFTPWLDTLDLARIAWPQLRRHSLVYLCQALEIPHTQAHRALADCQATAEVFIHAQQALLALPAKIWQNILAVCRKVDSPLSAFLLQLGKDIIKNAFVTPVGEYLALPATDNRDIPVRERRENWQYRLDQEAVSQWFAPAGLLAQKFSGYEAREQQQQLASKVCEAFNDQKILVAEAATGTGKSLAYLLPAVQFALGSDLPVAVSTHTINLQQQLWNKDIPFLQNLLEQNFSVALVKGRSNYLCRRKWREAANSATSKNLAFLLRLAVWLEQTATGDSAELHLAASDQREFQQLAAHAETCNSPWCKYKNSCYIQRMRRQAANADLLVINHSLLLSNGLWGGGALLPQLSHVIVDEAHHLEQVAEDQMTLSLSAAAITQVIARLERKDGFLSLLKGTLHDEQHETLRTYAKALKETFLELRDAAGEFFNISRGLLAKGRGWREQWRLTTGRTEPGWEGIEGSLSNLIYLLEQSKKQLLALHDTAEGFGESWLDTPWLSELPYGASSFAQLAQAGQLIVDGDLEAYAIWLSGGEKEPCLWRIAPLSVRQTLAELIYDDKASMVFTSATLESKGSFDFFCHGAGLDMAALPVETLRLSHTFDYTSQAKLFLPNDIPDFTQVTEIEAAQAIAQSLVPLIKEARGRALILFTSLTQLREVRNLIEVPLMQEGITVLAQGVDGSRESLLYRLQQEERVCLLGSSSFWEGVDVAGEALSLVIVVRLPFQPVFEPYTAAKLEKIAKEGRDPFRDYSLPQAVLRFKQGFGRLIRTKTDRGAFCVLDRRLWEKYYGRYFLQALPEMEKVQGTSAEIAWLIHDWLDPL